MMTKCFFCFENTGEEIEATRLMPQSVNQGKTVEMFACCNNHSYGWWDGADWDGHHLEIELEHLQNVQAGSSPLLTAPGITVKR